MVAGSCRCCVSCIRCPVLQPSQVPRARSLGEVPATLRPMSGCGVPQWPHCEGPTIHCIQGLCRALWLPIP